MSFRSLFQIPEITESSLRVWRRNLLFYRKTWAISLLWTILEPLMYLGAIGYGLGAYVNNMEGASYVEFFFPGILCSTAMTVAFFEGTYGCFTKLTWQKTYSTIMLTRVSPEDIVVGEILWTASKGFFGAIGVALVAALLGLIDSWRILPAFVIIALTSWVFSAIGMLVTSVVRNYDQFIYFASGFIVPMSLIAGVYFPLDQLPPGLRHAAWILPLTHSVNAVRSILNGNWEWSMIVHFVFLALVGWVATAVSIRRIKEKLLK